MFTRRDNQDPTPMTNRIATAPRAGTWKDPADLKRVSPGAGEPKTLDTGVRPAPVRVAPSHPAAPDEMKAAQPGAATPPAQVVPFPAATASKPPARTSQNSALTNPIVIEAKEKVLAILFDYIDIQRAAAMPRQQFDVELGEIADKILIDQKIGMSGAERKALHTILLDEMLGYGPLQPLIDDPNLNDILVNGPNKVFVERAGRMELTDVRFRNEEHVKTIAVRIATWAGRRVDEKNPICDARLADGSRVNIVAPPLAIRGTSISIRKFPDRKLSLDELAQKGSLSPAMARLLKVAAHSRLNILVSGGTGAGKTTLLNAMSSAISSNERIITIEDTAELRLDQDNVVTLEARIANVEGEGEVTIRHLLRNALRMRPDRIIVGEVRGDEVVDMLQAMNTGHDGSFCTIHSNGPRDALSRLENMVALSGSKLPMDALRTQIASAVDLIVHVERMRDGCRRVTHIVEVTDATDGVIKMQELFKFEVQNGDAEGNVTGKFQCSGAMPTFLQRALYFGLGDELRAIVRDAT